MATGFLALPAELLDIVLGNLDNSNDLLSLSLTCKALPAPTEPHLYRRIRLQTDDASGCSIQKVAKLFLSKPDVCRHVQTLHLSSFEALAGPHPRRERIQWRYSDFGPDGARKLRNLRDTIKRCHWSSMDGPEIAAGGWFTRYAVHEDGLVGILLTMIPRLKELHIVADPYAKFWAFGFINVVLRKPWPCDFSNLTSVCLDSKRRVPPWTVIVFLALPSLRSLKTRSLKDGRDSALPDDTVDALKERLNEAGSKVEVLHLQNTKLHPVTLDDVLRWTAGSLKAFKFEDYGHDAGRHFVQCSRLASSLEHVSDTLQDLEVTAESLRLHAHFVGYLQPLSHLVKLQRLKLNLDMFLKPWRWSGADRQRLKDVGDWIPPNLDTLVLLECGELSLQLMEVFHSLLDGCQKLQRLEIHGLLIHWVSDGQAAIPILPSDRESSDGTQTENLHVLGCRPKDRGLIPKRAGLSDLFEKAASNGVKLVIPIDRDPPRSCVAHGCEEDDDAYGAQDTSYPCI